MSFEEYWLEYCDLHSLDTNLPDVMQLKGICKEFWQAAQGNK